MVLRVHSGGMTTESSGVIGVVTACLVLLTAGCGGPPAERTPASAPLRLVAVGDSISTANECAGCTTFVDLYGQMITHQTGSPVQVKNLSVPGSGVAGLVKQTRTDAITRAALARADIVTVTIGTNDTPWNRVDDPCRAAPQYPFVKWADITATCNARVTSEYGASLDKILHTVTALHTGKHHLLLRLTTVYNAVLGDQIEPTWNSPRAVAPSVRANDAFAKVQCALATRYGGRCADMLHAMNGPSARRDAARYLASDHTHMNQHGHRLTARLLVRLGT